MGVDSRNRQAESGATANPWWPWLCLDAYELVVHPRMGRILYGSAVGPARRRQDLSP